MRNSSLYPKLALQSIRNNRKFYLPYLLALLGDVAALYIMSALVNDPGVADMTPGRPNGYMYVEIFMTIGMFIAYGFSVIFICYINGFLMKQRRKELGLYNILGMGKQHIAMVLVIEALYIGVIGIGGGIAVGMLLHKLTSLILHKLMGMPVPFGFYICWKGMAQTAILFAALLGFTLLLNLNKVRVSKPIELLHSGNVGEREPKTRWLMTLLGIVTLGAGYYIAVSTRTGMDAIVWYFVAVALVIAGTYCLFTAVSIFVLKALRKNKKFYYQTGHFIGVSGMLYRMKQNAVGLANICILCTMVMVMLSGTLSLYLGTDEMVKEQYPGDINITVRYYPQPLAADGEDWTPFDPDAMLSSVTDFIAGQGAAVENARTSYGLSFGVGKISEGVYTTDRFNAAAKEGIALLTCMTEANYQAVTGESLGLGPGEAAAYNMGTDSLTIRWTVPDAGTELGESNYRIVKVLRDNPAFEPSIAELGTIVVADDAAINELWAKQAEAYVDDWSSMRWCAYLDVDATEEELEKLASIQSGPLEIQLLEDVYKGTGSWTSCQWKLRSDGAADAYGLAGGFLFLGLFLGFIFLLATVLIIYYKQISEGYEDKDRFEIMQKVGLSHSEVKRSIHSQILMVFFLPIVVAAIHILFDFNMVEKLLTMFYIHNTTLTALCTLGTLLVFFAAYGIVYLLTARTYYKIVER